MEVSATSMASKPEDIHNPSSGMVSSSRGEESPKPQVQIQTRSEHVVSAPYPTTFVQADTSTFKHVVQMLTGSSETTVKHQESPPPPLLPGNNKGCFSIPPIKKANSFKLYERRQNNSNSNSSSNNMFMINTLRVHSTPRLMFSGNNHGHGHGHGHSPGFSPRNSEILLSPSMLDFPKLGLNSPVTPLSNDDPFNKASPLSLGNSSEEEKAIAEKGFYLHPSPISTPRDSEPQLLPLFPVTSPRISSDSSPTHRD
ncbi:PREDICTED: VQ motif-containing protein 33-like [Tarenaya hassleriana]|uniref:VQ motif-containing protein 33-like n=1 Tax=Tarenaya hassleriana TaxID=28532 RepID=UPI00053C2E76|nr:PREDICTED: VQ motif-containing protein 33-like [Tarenaya hassleriana]